MTSGSKRPGAGVSFHYQLRGVRVSRFRVVRLTLLFSLLFSVQGLAQPPAAPAAPHQHHANPDPSASAWTFMQDGVVYGMFNHQGGRRGGDEFNVPNWWMGMFSRDVGRSKVTLTTMLSLDPATVGKQGYREIFQVGEVFEGRPLIDHQHPHDLFMQLAAVWRTPLSDTTGLTIAGGPAGEPALGPVAFMHRLSAAENPIAPLGHHTFDSTHIAFGVVTAAVDRGPWIVEASVFNGREPDEGRWDFDFGRLDSVSGRVWYKPAPQWEFQVSSGRLVEPEELESGNVIRTTASAAWTSRAGSDFTAVTAAYGVNASSHGRRSAALFEATRRRSALSVYGRAELVQVESAVLLDGLVPDDHDDHPHGNNAAVFALTAGALRHFFDRRGWEGGLGAQITIHATPPSLAVTHGRSPVSFQVFFRLRSPAGAMGRMWNMRMAQPMAGHGMK
jgi:hypothetical protein